MPSRVKGACKKAGGPFTPRPWASKPYMGIYPTFTTQPRDQRGKDPAPGVIGNRPAVLRRALLVASALETSPDRAIGPFAGLRADPHATPVRSHELDPACRRNLLESA
jgi:hypothetical protein